MIHVTFTVCEDAKKRHIYDVPLFAYYMMRGIDSAIQPVIMVGDD